MKGLRLRFWIEAVLGLISVALFAVTLVTPDWLEDYLHIDPDAGNGSAEWLVVGGLLVVTLAMISLAGVEFRRARVAAG